MFLAERMTMPPREAEYPPFPPLSPAEKEQQVLFEQQTWDTGISPPGTLVWERVRRLWKAPNGTYTEAWYAEGSYTIPVYKGPWVIVEQVGRSKWKYWVRPLEDDGSRRELHIADMKFVYRGPQRSPESILEGAPRRLEPAPRRAVPGPRRLEPGPSRREPAPRRLEPPPRRAVSRQEPSFEPEPSPEWETSPEPEPESEPDPATEPEAGIISLADMKREAAVAGLFGPYYPIPDTTSSPASEDESETVDEDDPEPSLLPEHDTTPIDSRPPPLDLREMLASASGSFDPTTPPPDVMQRLYDNRAKSASWRRSDFISDEELATSIVSPPRKIPAAAWKVDKDDSERTLLPEQDTTSIDESTTATENMRPPPLDLKAMLADASGSFDPTTPPPDVLKSLHNNRAKSASWRRSDFISDEEIAVSVVSPPRKIPATAWKRDKDDPEPTHLPEHDTTPIDESRPPPLNLDDMLSRASGSFDPKTPPPDVIQSLHDKWTTRAPWRRSGLINEDDWIAPSASSGKIPPTEWRDIDIGSPTDKVLEELDRNSPEPESPSFIIERGTMTDDESVEQEHEAEPEEEPYEEEPLDEEPAEDETVEEQHDGSQPVEEATARSTGDDSTNFQLPDPPFNEIVWDAGALRTLDEVLATTDQPHVRVGRETRPWTPGRTDYTAILAELGIYETEVADEPAEPIEPTEPIEVHETDEYEEPVEEPVENSQQEPEEESVNKHTEEHHVDESLNEPAEEPTDPVELVQPVEPVKPIVEPSLFGPRSRTPPIRASITVTPSTPAKKNPTTPQKQPRTPAKKDPKTPQRPTRLGRLRSPRVPDTRGTYQSSAPSTQARSIFTTPRRSNTDAFHSPATTWGGTPTPAREKTTQAEGGVQGDDSVETEFEHSEEEFIPSESVAQTARAAPKAQASQTDPTPQPETAQDGATQTKAPKKVHFPIDTTTPTTKDHVKYPKSPAPKGSRTCICRCHLSPPKHLSPPRRQYHGHTHSNLFESRASFICGLLTALVWLSLLILHTPDTFLSTLSILSGYFLLPLGFILHLAVYYVRLLTYQLKTRFRRRQPLPKSYSAIPVEPSRPVFPRIPQPTAHHLVTSALFLLFVYMMVASQGLMAEREMWTGRNNFRASYARGLMDGRPYPGWSPVEVDWRFVVREWCNGVLFLREGWTTNVVEVVGSLLGGVMRLRGVGEKKMVEVARGMVMLAREKGPELLYFWRERMYDARDAAVWAVVSYRQKIDFVGESLEYPLEYVQEFVSKLWSR
jgi:hypothetical protein